MATFRIHQDSEKENSQQIQPVKLKGFPPANKDKRLHLSDINNVAHAARQQQPVKKADALKDVKSCVDENVAQQSYNNARLAELKKQTGQIFALETFQQFSVYQDELKPHGKIPGKLEGFKKDDKDDSDDGVANTLQSAIRHPLLEISDFSDGCLETPMSVADIHSPMSVDKSIEINDENNPSTSATEASAAVASQPSFACNDRERFYDVEEYQESILQYFYELEKKHRPKPHYMRRQADINSSMRTILVDWLVEVAEEYRLQSETLCLAVSYADRFLSYMSVARSKLQLVGTAALFIASKYEEIYPPDVGEFVFITDDTYTKSQVLRMEQIMLKILSFDLSAPTTHVFINTYAVLFTMPDQVKFLAIYLCELSLLEEDPYLQYTPSQISSAALALARYNLELPIWCPELEEITSYSMESLKDIILNLCRTHNESITMSQQAIQEKYKANKYQQVSTIKPIEMTELQFDKIVQEYNRLKNIFKSKEQSNDENSEETATDNENVRKRMLSLLFT